MCDLPDDALVQKMLDAAHHVGLVHPAQLCDVPERPCGDREAALHEVEQLAVEVQAAQPAVRDRMGVKTRFLCRGSRKRGYPAIDRAFLGCSRQEWRQKNDGTGIKSF